MIIVETSRPARLVASIHAPWLATVAECLSRWADLDRGSQACSYLVVDGAVPGMRHTLNAARIAELAGQPRASGRLVLPG